MTNYLYSFITFLANTIVDFVSSEPIIYLFSGFLLILIVKAFKSLML